MPAHFDIKKKVFEVAVLKRRSSRTKKRKKIFMKMQKRQFRIGQLAKKLDVERFVIRFWEKEFNLKPQRSEGGQRFYDEKDYEKFHKIKELLYKKGFTINGARKQLTLPKKEQVIGSHKTTIDEDSLNKDSLATTCISAESIERMRSLKNKLIKLNKLL